MASIPTASPPPSGPAGPIGDPGDPAEALRNAGQIFRGWQDLSRTLGSQVPSYLRRANKVSLSVMRPRR